MTDWAKVIKSIAPTAIPSIVKGLAEAMPQVIQIADLNTPLRQAHFLAQLAHESGGFRTTTEYASGKAYEGRRDLGNTQPGDGVRYKGRGLIQVTGRFNYRSMGKALGQNFEADPTEAADFPWAALTAAVYWKSRNINRPADRDDVRAVTKLINGGYNGLEDRVKYLARAKAALRQAALPQDGIDVAAAQRRLAELSYPLGAIDGKVGPLTRSATRDFQDAAGLPITGNFDQKTYDILMSPDAPHRPVSEERKHLSTADLKNAGSQIINSTETIKGNVTTAAGALSAAAGVATQVQQAAGQAQTVSDAVKTGHGFLSEIAADWKLIAIGVLLIVVVFCIYKIWKAASVVEQNRLDAARQGVNVRI